MSRQGYTPLSIPPAPHVQNLHLIARIVEFVHRDLSDSFEWESCVVPGGHAADEIAGKLCESSARKKAHNLLHVVITIDHQQERLINAMDCFEARPALP